MEEKHVPPPSFVQLDEGGFTPPMIRVIACLGVSFVFLTVAIVLTLINLLTLP